MRRGYYKHEAENAITTAVGYMEMIIRKEPHLGANEAAVEKAQLKLDSLVQLIEEIKLVSGCELSHDLTSRVANETFRAGQFFMKPNA